MRRRPLRGSGHVRLRGELSLLGVPAGDWCGLQPFAGIERDQLRVTNGDDNLMIVGDENGNDTRCKVCGSLLYSVVREGSFVHVAMGTLIDDPTIRPTSHIFVGSKARWFTISSQIGR
jgi:hypothetical protein